MVDFTKKVTKNTSALHPGEEVLAATFAQPPGSTKRSVAFGIGGAVGAAVAASRKGGSGDPARGSASRMPVGKNVVLAVTPMRFLVFEHKPLSGNAGELLAEFPLGDVSIEGEKRKLTHLLTIGFADGSSSQLEVARAAKPERFLEGFAAARG